MAVSLRYRVNSPLVMHEKFDTEAVIVHLETGSYYSAEGTGYELWSWLSDGRSVDEVCGLLADTCGLPAAQASEVVQAFLETLLADGLVVEDPSAAPESEAVVKPAAFSPPRLSHILGHAEFASSGPHPRRR